MALVGRISVRGLYYSRKFNYNVKGFFELNLKQGIGSIRLPVVGRSMSSGSSVTNIDINQLQTFQSGPSATIIDVRELSEIQETGKLPGSIHIPLGDLKAALQEDAGVFQQKYSKEKPSAVDPLVFSCRSGRRSMMAAESAVSLGYKKVYNYAGGWLDWIEHHPKE